MGNIFEMNSKFIFSSDQAFPNLTLYRAIKSNWIKRAFIGFIPKDKHLSIIICTAVTHLKIFFFAAQLFWNQLE